MSKMLIFVNLGFHFNDLQLKKICAINHEYLALSDMFFKIFYFTVKFKLIQKQQQGTHQPNTKELPFMAHQLYPLKTLKCTLSSVV